jgi:hypothetical protein
MINMIWPMVPVLKCFGIVAVKNWQRTNHNGSKSACYSPYPFASAIMQCKALCQNNQMALQELEIAKNRLERVDRINFSRIWHISSESLNSRVRRPSLASIEVSIVQSFNEIDRCDVDPENQTKLITIIHLVLRSLYREDELQKLFDNVDSRTPGFWTNLPNSYLETKEMLINRGYLKSN